MLCKVSLVAVLGLCFVASFTSANPTTVVPHVAEEATTVPPKGVDAVHQSIPTDGVNKPCSSKPYEAEPCGLKQHQGVFNWVTDTRKYEWIYMAFCITLGSCIFIIVISAAIYNAKTYRRKQAILLAHIREEDDRARAATVHERERRGSHLAQPRRSSLSVAIQDPASKK